MNNTLLNTNKAVAVFVAAFLAFALVVSGAPKAQAVTVDSNNLNISITPGETSATVEFDLPNQCSQAQFIVDYTLNGVAKTATINNGLDYITFYGTAPNWAVDTGTLPAGCTVINNNSNRPEISPSSSTPLVHESITISGLTAGTYYTLAIGSLDVYFPTADNVYANSASDTWSINGNYVNHNFTTTGGPNQPNPVNPGNPNAPQGFTENDAKAAAGYTNSKIADASNVKAVRVSLDSAKFGALVGTNVHVTGFSTPTDLGSVLVDGTAAAPFATVDVSALPKGTHTLAFHTEDGTLLDAVTYEKLVGNTAASDVNGLAIFALLALAGAGVVAMRKRA